MRYKGIRRPKTAQEIRENSNPEVVGLVRGARHRWNIPTSWDDIARRTVKSWKAYRKTQYRIVQI